LLPERELRDVGEEGRDVRSREGPVRPGKALGGQVAAKVDLGDVVHHIDVEDRGLAVA